MWIKSGKIDEKRMLRFLSWSNTSTTDDDDDNDNDDEYNLRNNRGSNNWTDSSPDHNDECSQNLSRSLLRDNIISDTNPIFANNPAHRNSEGDVDDEFELLVQAYMHDIHYTSRPQAVYSLCYAILNAGIVALPYAAYQAGLPIFTLAILLISLVSGYTTCMVIAMAEDKSSSIDESSLNMNSYNRLVVLKPIVRAVRTLEDLCELAFGKRGYYLVSLFQVVLSLVLMSLSLQIWADIMQSILASHLLESSVMKQFPILRELLVTNTGTVLLGSWIVLPLIVRSATMSSLRWTAYATVLAVAAGLLSVVYAFAINRTSESAPISVGDVSYWKSQWWAVCFIITLCFSYNQKTFSVYSCLRRRSAKRWQYSVKRATLIIDLLYLIFGIFGYLSHIEEGDLLNRFNYYLDFDTGGSIFFDVTRGIVAASLLFTIPVDCLVAATTLRRLYLRARCGHTLSKWFKFVSKFNTRSNFPLRFRDLLLKRKSGSSESLHPSKVVSDSEMKQNADTVVAGGTNQNPSPNVALPPSLSPRKDESELSEGSDAMGGRQHSIADIMNHYTSDSGTACCWFPDHIIPALVFWGISVAICCCIDNWVVLAASFGSVSTSVLVFILPSMLYFRLGLSSDYRAAPLATTGPFAGVIPNQAYMLLVQCLGLILVLANLACVMYVIVSKDKHKIY